ncbi:hypothetical protein MIND_00177200 [Mycena indigotica]|uniref:Uncharacterized protein n=1 Tax=Mycena indigotica TaxID=2126181 RepID=A0A8H6TFH2_9AGAR|nr:uncharacterized protein MIND_00177200 [Mycena indigotica]KAF7316575.1 hypothetical protein MIND_00177200 [Mycena indigotica]
MALVLKAEALAVASTVFRTTWCSDSAQDFRCLTLWSMNVSAMLFLLSLKSLRSGSYLATLDTACTDINSCRTLFNIIWGCFITVFLTRRQALELWIRWYLVDANGPILQRMKLMAVGLLAPELIIGFATRQYTMARLFAQKYDISLTHGFFIVMGGFIDIAGHPIATDKQLSKPGVVHAIRAVPETALEDKSKGDIFSKGIALCQGLWFILQCVARRAQHLPLTELEIATLAFAALNAVTWLLWLAKPLDVREPLQIALHTTDPPALPVHQGQTLVPATPGPSETANHTSFRNDLLHTTSAQYLFGAVFGGLHCLAWAAFFPSAAEQWLWRVSAVLVTTLPVTLIWFLWTVPVRYISQDIDDFESDSSSLAPYVTTLRAVLVRLDIAAYCVARIILIVLPLSTLRSLPPEAFIDVNWSAYIPHL